MPPCHSSKGHCYESLYFKTLYFQVLTAITIGVLLGHFYPEIGAQMKPLGDGFVKLIKMIIAPVIFFVPLLLVSRAWRA